MIFRESETTELKSELAPDICKEIIAFANICDGTLYIGIRNDGTVAGVPDPDSVIQHMASMIHDSIRPDVTMFVHYEIPDIDEKQIIAVTIQKGTQRPYYLNAKGQKPNGVYVRNGTCSEPLSETAIRRMIKETDGDSFEERRSLEQFLTFQEAQLRFQNCGLAFDPAKQKTLGIQTAEGIYTNLGLLLSDQCPATIKAAVFSGTDQREFQDRKEFSGSLLKQIEDLYACLDRYNRISAKFDGLYRTDTRDYPEDALREGLVNTAVHRDYSYSTSPLVRVYSDRIEFVFIGGLLPGISVDDIMLGLSVCRNPRLAAVFYRLKLIEAYGTGMPRILRAYEGKEIQPQIITTDNAFKLILPNRNKGNGSHRPAQKTESHLDSDSSLSTKEKELLDYLDGHGSITRREVDSLLPVSQSTSSRILNRLKSKGLLVQVGNGRTSRYERKP